MHVYLCVCVSVCVYRLPNATEVAATSLVQAVEEKFEMTHELNSKLITIKCSDTQRRTEVRGGCVRVHLQAHSVTLVYTTVAHRAGVPAQWGGVAVWPLACAT